RPDQKQDEPLVGQAGQLRRRVPKPLGEGLGYCACAALHAERSAMARPAVPASPDMAPMLALADLDGRYIPYPSSARFRWLCGRRSSGAGPGCILPSTAAKSTGELGLR